MNRRQSQGDVNKVPANANILFGCSNPQVIADLAPGETVLDLGSGRGFDCFLAARTVGDQGFVIGVDMNPEMIVKARQNAHKAGIKNIDFRLGEIESLPVEDNTIDVIISNCVINLSPDKGRVFQEAFRVLKAGGRLAITDIVATTPLPDNVREDPTFYVACVAGAIFIDDVEIMLKEAGFVNLRIHTKDESKIFINDWLPGRQIEDYVVSAEIEALKPKRANYD
jgi:ubiquinone/menaquinone biosynthesis C-methylase UbiE